MASTSTNRRQGVNSGAAVKVPCRCATTANITLSGEQTIDGVAVVADDRVLVKDQTTGADNGIYVASTSTWQRALDFDGTFDVVQGTLVPVANGTVNGAQIFRISTANPITIGTTSLSFVSALEGISDGDKGDITVSGSGTVWTIDAGVVTTTKLGGDITTAGKELLDDANAVAQLVTLGLTATAAEINALDGITSTVTELNYTDGVTSAIQTQLDAKISSSDIDGAYRSEQVYTATGANTWTKPSGLKRVIVEVWGAGGGGGGSDTDGGGIRGVGGGGGGYSRKKIEASSLGATETATVGAGGSGGASQASPTAGSVGGTSSFGAHCSATGGSGGSAATSGAMAGVSGGSGSGGDLNLTGGDSDAKYASADTNTSGPGGMGAMGGSGGRTNIGVAGVRPGGGGATGNHTGGTGGAGGDGLIIVREFF